MSMINFRSHMPHVSPEFFKNLIEYKYFTKGRLCLPRYDMQLMNAHVKKTVTLTDRDPLIYLGSFWREIREFEECEIDLESEWKERTVNQYEIVTMHFFMYGKQTCVAMYASTEGDDYRTYIDGVMSDQLLRHFCLAQ